MEVCKTKELYTNNLDLGKPKAGKYFSTLLWVTVFKTLFLVFFLQWHCLSRERFIQLKQNQVAVTDFSAELSQVKNYTWFLKNIQEIGELSSAKASSAFNL